MEDDRQSIAQRLNELSGEDRRISCEDAWSFADENGLSKAETGALCNELGIKIFACQLGCF